MATFKLFSPVLDFGLNTLDTNANKILICSAEPTTYTEASATFKLGEKSFGAGNCFGTPGTYSGGRTIASAAITNGTVTTSGTPVCWAVIDDANSRLLASGPMSGAAAVTAGQQFTLASFTIDQPSGAAFPQSGAAVDLWFTAGSYYPSAVTSLLAITRASTAMTKNGDGTLTSTASGALRIGAGGGGLGVGSGGGLWAEYASTNLCPYSLVATPNWSLVAATSATGATPPDSTSSSTKIIPDTSSGQHYIQMTPGVSFAAGQDYVFAVFARANGYTSCTLQIVDGLGGAAACPFDLVAGTVGTTTQTGDFSQTGGLIEPFSNGWYRCSVHSKHGAAAGAATLVLFPNNNGNYVGNASNGVDFWGAQLEANYTPSSYIPTSGSTVARAADAITFTSTALTPFTSNLFSCVLDVISANANISYNQARILGEPASGPSPTFMYVSGGVASYNGVLLTTPLGSSQAFESGVRIACSQNSSGRSIVGGGGTVATDANQQAVTASPGLGGAAGGATGWLIRRCTIWSSRLADATLQSLTLPD